MSDGLTLGELKAWRVACVQAEAGFHGVGKTEDAALMRRKAAFLGLLIGAVEAGSEDNPTPRCVQ